MAASSADLTRSAILAHIGRHGPTSRAELSRSLNVSSALVTQVSKRLIAQGFLEETAIEASRGGRPAQLLGLVQEAGYAVGIKVVADHLTFVDVTLDGQVLRSETEHYDARSATALATLVQKLQDFISRSDQTMPLLGIGIAVPGSVSDQALGVVDSTQIGWNQVPLGEYVRNEVNLPVLVDNNVNALAVAEQLYGQAQGREDVLVITAGTGIGAGIIADGSVIRGAEGAAGEIGHFPIVGRDALCQCGNRGCLEAIVGEAALIRTAQARGIIGPNARVDELVEQARQGNAEAVEIYREAGALLGSVVAGATNLLNPDVLVLSGEGISSWEYWAGGFEASLRPALIPKNRGILVRIERWDDDRWAQGAASMVLASPFDVEGVTGKQGELVRQRLLTSAAASLEKKA